MKNINGVLVAFCLFLSALMALEVEVGKVIAVKGTVKIRHGLVSKEMTLDQKVYQGDVIKSSESSHVTIETVTGHKIFVLASTSMTLVSGGQGIVHIDQDTGSIWTKVQPLKKEQVFEIRTPSAVAGVRGTAFISMVMDPETTSLCVCEGKVEVTSGGETQVVSEGFGSMLIKDQPPQVATSNRGKIQRRRQMARKGACMSCHWNGEGDTSRLDENSNLIFRSK